jgi:2-oxoglutarate dehydrogenase E2 component (dihydrolipoamide succinyltransferase)
MERAQVQGLFEKKHGVRLGFMGFFAKAACLALKDVPSVNARSRAMRSSITTMSTCRSRSRRPTALSSRWCAMSQLSFADIEKGIGDLGKRAKDGTLTMEDMKGGTFTISNGGVFGGLMSTPIINPPQSAVLGLHRIEDRPVVVMARSSSAR